MEVKFTTRRLVEFSETDMAGIVYFANFFKWMESAENAFFMAMGEPIFGETQPGFQGDGPGSMSSAPSKHP